MSRFLFTAWPIPGHYFPLIAIAKALQERGHQIAFYSGHSACQVLEDEGFRCFPFSHVNEEILNNTVLAPQGGSLQWNRLFQLRKTFRAWLLETIPQQVADLEEVIKAWRPDVIGCDPTLWAPILILHERDSIPVAVTSFVPVCLVPGPEHPNAGLGLAQPHNWFSRLLALMIRAINDLGTRGFRQAADDLRRQFGLPPIKSSVTMHTGRMPLYLVPSAPEFDYYRGDLPPAVHYVGPCLWNKSGQTALDKHLNRWDGDKPLVHVSEGTIHTIAPLVLRAAAQGLANLPMHVIMTTGGNRDPATLDLGPLSPNIQVLRWISHSALFPHTDLVITTGGAGTVLAALNAGVPLLIIPTGWDKPEIAQRVVECGAGLRLSPSRCTPNRLRQAVERILSEPSFCQNAKKMATILGNYGGPSAAADLLIKLSPDHQTSMGTSARS